MYAIPIRGRKRRACLTPHKHKISPLSQRRPFPMFIGVRKTLCSKIFMTFATAKTTTNNHFHRHIIPVFIHFANISIMLLVMFNIYHVLGLHCDKKKII